MDILEYTVADDAVKFIDSSLHKGKIFTNTWDTAKKNNPENPVLVNTHRFHAICEWSTHKALYWLHIERDRTKDTDIDYPQPLSYYLGYLLMGIFTLPFTWFI